MKYPFQFVLACLLAIGMHSAFGADGPTLHADAWKNTNGWWTPVTLAKFDINSIKKQLPSIRVDGNKFVNDQGKVVIFRGVNISDPDKLVTDGRFDRQHFEMAQSWGANVIRIPVHPSAWRKRGKDEYLTLLDQAIQWTNEMGMYTILDWHSMGNLKSDLYQTASYATTKAETFDFFRIVSDRYKDVHSVAMYEVFNEPTVFNGQLGVLSWADWKLINEEAITIIQAHNPKAIALVAGFNWAYDLKPVAAAPIERSNVAYVSHPYPMKVGPPFEEHWERDWGYLAARFPVIATELGYQLAGTKGAHIPVIDDGSYGPRITNYMEKKGISWVAWVFDPDWAPQLIEDWSYRPTLQGRHFREAMQLNGKK